MLGRAIEPTNLTKEVTEARFFIVDASGKRLLSNRDKGLDRFLVGRKDIAVAASRLMMKRCLLQKGDWFIPKKRAREAAADLQWSLVDARGLRRTSLVVGRVLLGGEQDEGVAPYSLLKREDRLSASDEERRDHVRKYDDVAQRQYRIDSGFTRRKQWTWLCSGHSRKSALLSLSAPIRLCAELPRQSAGGPAKEGPPQRNPRSRGRNNTLFPFSNTSSS
jgi:hypothetical protein